MKKDVFFNSVVYLICMVAACLLNLAISGLVVRIVLSVEDIGFFATSVLRFAVGFFTGGVIIGAVIGREGYKSLEFRPLSLTLSMLMAGVAHLLLSLLLRFYPFIAGGTRFLAGVLQMGDGFNRELKIEKISLGSYLAAFGIYLAFEIVVALIASYVGKRLRYRNRKTIKGYSEEEK